MPPQEVEQHWAYRLTDWVLHHGAELLPAGVALLALLFLVCLAGVWLQAGARWIAVFWVWREFLRGLRSRSLGPSGGAGGHTYSSEYAAFMQSGEWRRQRGRVLRRDGHRCRACGGRATDAHHRWYARPIEATPDHGIEALCEGCHQRAHGRG